MTETSVPPIVVAIVDRDRIFSLGLQAWTSERLGRDRAVIVEVYERVALLLEALDNSDRPLALAIVGNLPAAERACQLLCERDIPVLTLVDTLTATARERLLAIGVRGAFRKTADAEQIVAAIWQVLDGGEAWSPTDDSVANLDPERLAGVKYIEAMLARLDRRLERTGLTSIERLFIEGQRREARVAHWLASRLTFASGASSNTPRVSETPSTSTSRPAIPQDRAIEPLTGSTALVNSSEIRALCIDRILAQLQGPTTNLSSRPLEIDILSDTKRRELLAIVLRRFDDALSKAVAEDLTVDRLYDNRDRILTDLWSEATLSFFGYYRTAAIDGRTISIVDAALEKRKIVRRTILTRIPFFAELLAYFICGAPLVVDNATYGAETEEALYRAQMLLENTLVHVANGIVQPLLECFGDVEAVKRDFYDRRLLTTREIERFRNELSWKYRWQTYISEPADIYESRHQIYVLGERGIRYLSIYAPRRHELDLLGSFQQAVTLVLEGRDALAPRVRRVVSILGTGLVYVLTQVVGRGLGLVGRGILDGIGNTRLDRDERTKRSPIQPSSER